MNPQYCQILSRDISYTDMARFWDRVNVKFTGNGCWEWDGFIDPNGYARFKTIESHKRYLAHRLSYALAFGETPKGMHICHKCDNRKCVRPDHLFVGTAKDNIHDMIGKKRHSYGEKNPGAKLDEDKVRDILSSNASLMDMSNQYNVSKKLILNVKQRKAWKHVNIGQVQDNDL